MDLVLRIICQLYRKQELIIEVGEERESAMIRQGCLFSAIIFNISVENAIR